jgi:hypothetical protein
MRKQNLFKVILRGAVVAVRPVALAYLGLYELLVDLVLRPPRMRGEIDEGGKARELRNGAAQFGFRSDFDQRKKPRHDGADAHRDWIDAEGRAFNFPCGDRLWLRRITGSSAPASSMNVSSTHASAGTHA